MGIYGTHEGLTKEQAIEIIRDRVKRLEQMHDQRIVEILEACVQGRYFIDRDTREEQPDGWDDEFAYNNFWDKFEK